jgi:hypothetical protein
LNLSLSEFIQRTSGDIQITLQQDGRGHFIDFFFPFIAAHIALDQYAVGHGGRKPLVPQLDGNRDGAFQGFDKGLDFLRGGTIGTVHVARHADENEVARFLGEDLLEPLEKIGQRLGGNVFKRLGDGAGFIADRHANPPGSMIKGEGTHYRDSFALKRRGGEPI